MASNTDPALRVVQFTSPSLTADVRLKVFYVEYHVHSYMLKHHIGYFCTFFESADKVGTLPASPGFKFEWITEIDKDDTKAWNLVSSTSPVSDQDMDSGHSINSTQTKVYRQQIAADYFKFTGDREQEIGDFEIILKAIYQEPYSIKGKDQLCRVTKLADYYLALRVFSRSLDGVIGRWPSGLKDLWKDPCGMLEVSRKLRNAMLFRECISLSVGPWSDPHFKTFQISDEPYHAELYKLASALYGQIGVTAARAHTCLMKFFDDLGEEDLFLEAEMQEHLKLAATTSRTLPENDLSLPLFYHSLWHFRCRMNPDMYPFRRAGTEMDSIMQNSLLINI